MRALYVMDHLATLNLAGDSTFMLMKESTGRGWDVSWCHPWDLYATGGRAWTRALLVIESDGEYELTYDYAK